MAIIAAADRDGIVTAASRPGVLTTLVFHLGLRRGILVEENRRRRTAEEARVARVLVRGEAVDDIARVVIDIPRRHAEFALAKSVRRE